jgi:hypothetical protein
LWGSDTCNRQEIKSAVAPEKRSPVAYKVKSFGIEIRPLKTMKELDQLDDAVNAFLTDNKVKQVLSVSDVSTTDDSGETIGLIRVIAYEE